MNKNFLRIIEIIKKENYNISNINMLIKYKLKQINKKKYAKNNNFYQEKKI